MSNPLTPQEFVAKWRNTELKERSSSQEHFIDLCRLFNHPTPAELDPTGDRFTFERGASKQRGGQGWADVWYKGRFAWEYKGKHADLDKAYQQLLQYREALENPPLLIVSDMERILIHTNFTNTVKRVHELGLDDLLDPAGLEKLRAAFHKPGALRTPQTTEQVTEEAAREFAHLADHLRKWGEDSHKIAHFLIRLLFCLFAEDIGLLPRDLFSRLIERTRHRSPAFVQQLRQLFAAMETGGWFGVDEIRHFDGSLFDDETVLELDSDALDILGRVSRLDWSSIEPSILGTLFERSLDPNKRAQLGTHYTSKEDIMLIVEPVLMAPLRRRWQDVKEEAQVLAEKRDQSSGGQRTRRRNELVALLTGFSDEIAQVRVLDPACGSGNFLYVALRQLLDLQKEIITLAGDLGVGRFFPGVSPEQLYGIEIDDYAHELAQTTVWIGYIQWLNENGFGRPSEPILKPIDNIRHMDAILAYDENRHPVEPEWPEADVAVGNPPFLGDRKMRRELGDEYVETLRSLYGEQLPPSSDLVCYWFEQARRHIDEKKLQRAGLLATQSIRGGSNRVVLERIKDTGDIFWAQSDRDWILEGARVNVSMVGFDDGSADVKLLDDKKVGHINPDLTSQTDVTQAKRLQENQDISFIGTQKSGPFDLTEGQAEEMLRALGNPNGRPNSDVIKPWINATDITKRPRHMWIIDFGTDMPVETAALYEMPFEYVREHVKPKRDKVRRKRHREKWWLFGDARPGMRNAIRELNRYIVTPMVSKHRVFAWVDVEVISENLLVVIARDDDYFFGVLQSKIHEVWALRQGTALEDRPRYTPTTTFETFPFPWPPGKEPKDDPRVQTIAEAARDLVEKRQAWLIHPDISEKELKKRTLTNLYNEMPMWLQLAHERLDKAVPDAYGWPHALSDEEILVRLLDLNLKRAGEIE